MKIVICACLCLILASCSLSAPPDLPASSLPSTSATLPEPSATPLHPAIVEPVATLTQTLGPTQDLLSTLVAFTPSIEVTFDGTSCKVNGSVEIPPGGFVLTYNNSTGHIATPWVSRHYPGKTWQDVLDFIGEPGSYTPTSPTWIAILGYSRSVSESPVVSYRQYDLTIEGEYSIVVEYPSDHMYPCGPFTVRASAPRP